MTESALRMGHRAMVKESAPAPAASAGPARIWLLLGARAGDRAQVEALGAAVARELGWSCETKRIVANGLFRIPNLLLDSTLLSVDRDASSSLTAPWPDLVIAAGRRTVPAARWIRRQSGGRTRLVHVGRPWAPLGWFDLVATTAQYGLPERPNVLRNTLPLSPLDPTRLAEAAARWEPRFAALPRPWIGILVGGEARPYRLDPGAAARLAAAANRIAGGAGGSLLVATSPRTPAAAAATLEGALAAPHLFHRWQAGADNPYPAILALADRFLVSGDSASMLAEACAAGAARGAPVRIFELPERPDWRLRLATALRRLAGQGGKLSAAYRLLVALGLLTSTRDMKAFHAALIARGLALPLDGAETRPRADAARLAADELAGTVARVCALCAPAERPAP